MDSVKSVFGEINNTLGGLLQNPYVSAVLTIFVILYASLAAPKLPSSIAKLFDFWPFKIAFLALILLVREYNPTIALVTAVAFFLSLQAVSRYKMQGLAQYLTTLKNDAMAGVGVGKFGKNVISVGKDVVMTGADLATSGIDATMGGVRQVTRAVTNGSMPNGALPVVSDEEAGAGVAQPVMMIPGSAEEQQVSGLASRTSEYQGPQGMEHPVGYPGNVQGSDVLY